MFCKKLINSYIILMLLIYKDTFTDNILTLSEKTTLTDATYLFEFVNDETKTKYYYIGTDISGNKERFNKFRITEGSTLILPTGFYKYNVYEQSSTTNIDPLLTANLVDIGKLSVVENNIAPSEFSATQENYVVYGG